MIINHCRTRNPLRLMFPPRVTPSDKSTKSYSPCRHFLIFILIIPVDVYLCLSKITHIFRYVREYSRPSGQPLYSRVNNSWIELSKRKSSNEQVIFLRFLSRWLNRITDQWPPYPPFAAFPHRKSRAHWSSRSIDYQFLIKRKVNRFEQKI